MTGASSGIGAATCRKLREQGWHVAGLARRPSDEASVSLQLDVTSFDQLEEAFGLLPRLRLLVHSAGTIQPVGPLLKSDPVEWRRAVEVNLIGTYNVLRAGLSQRAGFERRPSDPHHDGGGQQCQALLERLRRLEGWC